jgi:acetyl/propionyl-CoA carboxylase alpha subunit
VNTINKLAIANRGEVAARIILACKELGITTVLLHSEADINSRAYRMSDEVICIGPSELDKSYLSIERNIQGILSSGADAVHPGFGFLSENAEFAQACLENKITFIGPYPQTIRDMGDKITAKKLVEEEGLPTVPGYDGQIQELDRLVTECERIGYPVIVKAAAGGGGRGMKIVRTSEEARELIPSAQREAKSAFGSSNVFLEKYLDSAKHVEVQIFGDLTGHVVHLHTRECSVQRRHQKVIEEAGIVGLDKTLSEQVCAAAVSLAKKVNYLGAGTVEFLIQDGKYYFMEMNTRLQVEHTVTEMTVSVDLVKAQLLSMMNRPLVWQQKDLQSRGHAIECRIYAEDPFTAGVPSIGTILLQKFPIGPNRRFDFGFEEGDSVTTFYDSMIAKIIVWDESRPRAIIKMIETLKDTVIFGVKTNIPFLLDILHHQQFMDGTHNTSFIKKYFPEGAKPYEMTTDEKLFFEEAKKKSQSIRVGSAPSLENNSPWQQPWRQQ